MSLPLITVLGALQAVPSIIALASGSKDLTTRIVLGLGAVIAGVLALEPVVGVIDDLVSGTLLQVLAVACGVLGVISAVRVPNRIIGTLTATAGSLIALLALRLVS